MTTKIPLEQYLYNSQIKLPDQFRLRRKLMLHEPTDPYGDNQQPSNKDDYDSPWKEALDLVFKDFVALYIPDVYALINWDQGYTALDGELQSIQSHSKQGRKLVDKLMQVHLKDGTSAAALLKAVNNASADKLIHTLPRHTLTAGTTVLDCSLNLTLPIVNLRSWLDHEQTLETLTNTNPFAVITLAQLAALKYKKDKANRLQPKIALVRKLQSYGYSQGTIITLFRLIDWLVKLPQQSEAEFIQLLHNRNKEQNVRYVTPYERFTSNKANAAMLLRQLTRKFSSVPEAVAERLENANQEQLESWSINFVDAETLDDVFKQ